MSNATSLVPLARPVPHRRDQEFLPGALEIIETPASPITAALIATICALATISILWAYFSRIDVIATAPGKFQPAGRVKVVQPVEGGKVAMVNVGNGSHVEAGDVLFELDGTEARAEEAGIAADLASAEAEAARRRTALGAVLAERYANAVIPWTATVPAALRQREERVLRADLRQLSSNLASLEAQLHQKEVETNSLAGTVAAERGLIDVLQDRVNMRSVLVAENAGTKAALLDALETLHYQITQLATQNGQLEQAKAAIEVAQHEMAKTRDTFASENAQKLADLEKQIDDEQDKLIKARATSGHMTIRSPVAGIVQASTLTHVGQILTAGSPTMRIVPDGATLEIEAYAANRDIGFIRAGQPAVVKIESFPFTQYGTVNATVTRVATDAIPEPDARAMEGDPTRPAVMDGVAGGEKTQNLVFPITLTTNRMTMPVGQRNIALEPGMSVNVEVRTGRRRILEYLFSPLVETVSSAMSER